ncbi:AraC family transcriptional regulator [Sphingomonas sp. Leaf412]|uniref:AraC family transcriptional regulator n=1 Tax=Sphingomonas sp. Leaf412 TaxID=1736370 RepID=UPI0006F32D07|nr:AraC family transcriptional regulator [Sphingomonas sp. Leaf412]KQT32491.1 AraC family transcriptional regulator [Sphingomonas sp. Leaf412]
MSSISLEYRVPPDDLRPYVTLFYHFRTDAPALDEIERADHAQLRFRLDGGSAHYRIGRGPSQQVGPCHVIGPTSGAIRVNAAGPIELVGLGLQPAGWAALLHVDASVMVDRVFDAGKLFGEAWCSGAADRLRTADGTDEKVAAVAALLRAMLDRGDMAALDFARAIDAWLAASPSPAVDDLVAATGLSRRQVERRTKALYGVPPKVLARKYRALRAAVTLASGAAISDALVSGGFYDQSHLNREIKQFAGMTPRQMRAAPGLLSHLTISQRRALEGQVSTIISDT